MFGAVGSFLSKLFGGAKPQPPRPAPQAPQTPRVNLGQLVSALRPVLRQDAQQYRSNPQYRLQRDVQNFDLQSPERQLDTYKRAETAKLSQALNTGRINRNQFLAAMDAVTNAGAPQFRASDIVDQRTPARMGYDAVIKPTVDSAKRAGTMISATPLNPGVKPQDIIENTANRYYKALIQKGVNPQQAADMAAGIREQGYKKLLGDAGIGLNDSKTTIGRKAVGDIAGTALNIAPVGQVGRTAPLLKKVAAGAKLGAGGGVLAGAAQDNATPLSVAQQALSGAVVGGAIPIAGRGLRGLPKAAKDVADGNALTPRNYRISKNERFTLADYADYQMGLYKPKGEELNKLIREARQTGKKIGMDVTSGSAVEVRDRIAEFLDDFDQFNPQSGHVQVGKGQPEPPPRNQPLGKKAKLNASSKGSVAKQRDYTIRTFDTKGNPTTQQISAKPVRVTDGVDTIIHREPAYGKEWTVSEASTGLKIATGRTQKEASANALKAIQDHPDIQTIISKQRERFGVKPEATQPKARPEVPSIRTQTTKAPVLAKNTQQTTSSPRISASPKSKIGQQLAQQQSSSKAQGAAVPGAKSPLSADNTTNIKISQRGGEKKVTVGRVTLPKDLVGDPEQWKDVGSTLKSMDRNLEAAAPSKQQYKKIHDFLIEPRGRAVTEMVDEMAAIKADLKKLVDSSGLKNKTVRADVMRFGEKRITFEELVGKHGRDQADKIVAADNWFRSQYDSILDETNAVLRKFKQPEIPRRDNYYTHFSDDNLWANVGLKIRQLGQRGDVLQETGGQALRGKGIDPKLLGQSEFTTPNKKWNPYAQRRLGDKTKFDAVEAFERYLIPTLHNKHLTESVVKTRMVTRAFQDATAETKHLPTFIRQLQEYGNALSGKTNRFDRPLLETKWGKRALDTTRYMQQQMGRNTILGSVRSAIMQTAGLPLSIKEAGLKNTALGLMEEIGEKVAGKDAVHLSPFLRRRYADLDSVLPSNLRKAENVAGFAFEQIEQTTTKGVWRAQHRKALERGLSGSAALKEADRITERLVGGRQIGERAEAFRSIMGNTAMQFQLEVNNFMQEVMKDAGDKEVKKVLKLFAATYAFNSLVYDPLLNDRPLPDPVDAAIETFQAVQNGQWATAAGRLPAEVLSNVPGGSLAAGLYPEYGTEVAGVKLPTREKLFGDTEAGRYGGSLAALGTIKNPEFLIPKSFGLKQVERTFGGIKDFMAGEKQDSKGKKQFDIEQTPGNAVRAGLLGSFLTNEGKKYLDDKSARLKGESKPTTDMAEQVGKDAISSTEKGKAWSEQTAENRKKWANTDPELRQLNKEFEGAKTAAKPRSDLPSGLTDAESKLINRRDHLTTEGWKRLTQRQPELVNQYKAADLKRQLLLNDISQEEYNTKLAKLTPKTKTPKVAKIKKAKVAKAKKVKVARAKTGRKTGAGSRGGTKVGAPKIKKISLKVAKAPNIKAKKFKVGKLKSFASRRVKRIKA